MTKNKSASNQKQRGKEKERRPSRGLHLGVLHQGGGGGGFPGQAGAAREASAEEAGRSGWGLGLGVPSVQPSYHGHRDKEGS